MSGTKWIRGVVYNVFWPTWYSERIVRRSPWGMEKNPSHVPFWKRDCFYTTQICRLCIYQRWTHLLLIVRILFRSSDLWRHQHSLISAKFFACHFTKLLIALPLKSFWITLGIMRVMANIKVQSSLVFIGPHRVSGFLKFISNQFCWIFYGPLIAIVFTDASIRLFVHTLLSPWG